MSLLTAGSDAQRREMSAAVIDLVSWVFTAFCTLFGFCSAVKRTAERITQRYLRWRKVRRASRQAMAAAQN